MNQLKVLQLLESVTTTFHPGRVGTIKRAGKGGGATVGVSMTRRMAEAYIWRAIPRGAKQMLKDGTRKIAVSWPTTERRSFRIGELTDEQVYDLAQTLRARQLGESANVFPEDAKSGEVHHRADGDYKKQSDGSWAKVADKGGHGGADFGGYLRAKQAHNAATNDYHRAMATHREKPTADTKKAARAAHAVLGKAHKALKATGMESLEVQGGGMLEATSVIKLDSHKRSALTHDFMRSGMDGNGRFRSVGEALSKLGSILAHHGLEWDETLNAHLFMHDAGNRGLHIALSNQDDPFSPMPVANTVVAISWTKLDRDRFEVVAYMS